MIRTFLSRFGLVFLNCALFACSQSCGESSSQEYGNGPNTTCTPLANSSGWSYEVIDQVDVPMYVRGVRRVMNKQRNRTYCLWAIQGTGEGADQLPSTTYYEILPRFEYETQSTRFQPAPKNAQGEPLLSRAFPTDHYRCLHQCFPETIQVSGEPLRHSQCTFFDSRGSVFRQPSSIPDGTKLTLKSCKMLAHRLDLYSTDEILLDPENCGASVPHDSQERRILQVNQQGLGDKVMDTSHTQRSNPASMMLSEIQFEEKLSEFQEGAVDSLVTINRIMDVVEDKIQRVANNVMDVTNLMREVNKIQNGIDDSITDIVAQLGDIEETSTKSFSLLSQQLLASFEETSGFAAYLQSRVADGIESIAYLSKIRERRSLYTRQLFLVDIARRGESARVSTLRYLQNRRDTFNDVHCNSYLDLPNPIVAAWDVAVFLPGSREMYKTVIQKEKSTTRLFAAKFTGECVNFWGDFDESTSASSVPSFPLSSCLREIYDEQSVTSVYNHGEICMIRIKATMTDVIMNIQAPDNTNLADYILLGDQTFCVGIDVNNSTNEDREFTSDGSLTAGRPGSIPLLTPPDSGVAEPTNQNGLWVIDGACSSYENCPIVQQKFRVFDRDNTLLQYSQFLPRKDGKIDRTMLEIGDPVLYSSYIDRTAFSSSLFGPAILLYNMGDAVAYKQDYFQIPNKVVVPFTSLRELDQSKIMTFDKTERYVPDQDVLCELNVKKWDDAFPRIADNQVRENMYILFSLLNHSTIYPWRLTSEYAMSLDLTNLKQDEDGPARIITWFNPEENTDIRKRDKFLGDLPNLYSCNHIRRLYNALSSPNIASFRNIEDEIIRYDGFQKFPTYNQTMEAAAKDGGRVGELLWWRAKANERVDIVFETSPDQKDSSNMLKQYNIKDRARRRMIISMIGVDKWMKGKSMLSHLSQKSGTDAVDLYEKDQLFEKNLQKKFLDITRTQFLDKIRHGDYNKTNALHRGDLKRRVQASAGIWVRAPWAESHLDFERCIFDKNCFSESDLGDTDRHLNDDIMKTSWSEDILLDPLLIGSSLLNTYLSDHHNTPHVLNSIPKINPTTKWVLRTFPDAIPDACIGPPVYAAVLSRDDSPFAYEYWLRNSSILPYRNSKSTRIMAPSELAANIYGPAQRWLDARSLENGDVDLLQISNVPTYAYAPYGMTFITWSPSVYDFFHGRLQHGWFAEIGSQTTTTWYYNFPTTKTSEMGWRVSNSTHVPGGVIFRYLLNENTPVNSDQLIINALKQDMETFSDISMDMVSQHIPPIQTSTYRWSNNETEELSNKLKLTSVYTPPNKMAELAKVLQNRIEEWAQESKDFEENYKPQNNSLIGDWEDIKRNLNFTFESENASLYLYNLFRELQGNMEILNKTGNELMAQVEDLENGLHEFFDLSDFNRINLVNKLMTCAFYACTLGMLIFIIVNKSAYSYVASEHYQKRYQCFKK
jgi:hypothetical protein